MKKSNKKMSVKFLAILTLFPIAVMLTQLYYTYEMIDTINVDEKYDINLIEERKWDLIENIIEENEAKANIVTDDIKERITERLLTKYEDNMPQLHQDLVNYKKDSPAMTILNDAIDGRYLNVQNDNNRVYIANREGIIADKGILSSYNKINRKWNSEINAKIDKSMANTAIRMILSKDRHLIVWDAEAINWDKKPISSKIVDRNNKPDMQIIKETYKSEGLIGLRRYDVLVPAYITDNGDIFGVPDVNNHGLANKNNKLIIIQEFNIYDAVMSHMDDLRKYDKDIANVKDRSDLKRSRNLESFVIVMILTFCATIAILYGANVIIKWGGDDDSD